MNHLVITIESGVVSDFWTTEPLSVTVVDYDVIEGGDGFDRRMKKAVLALPAGNPVLAEGIETLVRSLVAACERPIPRILPDSRPEQHAA